MLPTALLTELTALPIELLMLLETVEMPELIPDTKLLAPEVMEFIIVEAAASTVPKFVER
jgi:hypothetical protein